MKLKLDENLPSDIAGNLKRHGHDVDTVAEENLDGEADSVVLEAATSHERMVITLDRGFGDVRAHPPGTHSGIIVLRPDSQDPTSIDHLVDRFLYEHDLADLEGCLVVVEARRIRVRRPYP